MTYRRTIGSGLQKLLYWLGDPSGTYALWFGKYCVAAAWLGLTLAVVSPPHGSGISVCWLQAATGLPCPGCGMTRSLSCALRGMLFESWSYHPFGLPILSLFVATAAQSLLPLSAKGDLAGWMRGRAKFFNAVYLGFVVLFVAFGTVRALIHFQAEFLG